MKNTPLVSRARMDGPFGALLLRATPHGITSIAFDAEDAELVEPSATSSVDARRWLDAARRQLDEYFAGTRVRFELSLAAIGTPFQRAVWTALHGLPFGATTSYVALARALGRPTASRAIGSANARNPIAIVVPCHRVIGADGSLTGYAGGLARKRWLLGHERGVLGRSAGIASV
jgi:methylated-DNA-[protein]-cysteine S-methyltransferase